MNLDELRSKIDLVDDEMISLYEKRMALARSVGEAKKDTGMKVENRIREKEILNRVTAELPDSLKLYAKQLFTTLFDTSKAYQLGFYEGNSPTAEKIRKAVAEKKSFPVSANVACQGVAGAYSSVATEKVFGLSNILYFKDFDGVFNAVEKGLCEYGVLPIENSTAGSVNAVYDLMKKHNFYIVRSVKIPVKHCLLAKSGTEIGDVKRITSHEQALLQCQDFLKKIKGVETTVCENTAVAAKTVSESNNKELACIAGRDCASIYGLKTICADIQDNRNNYTRFIVISKKAEIFEDSNKISVMVNLEHEAGSLNRLLNKFSALGLNLTKLESRPLPNTDFEFAFYFDFEADVNKKEVQNLIAELENSSNEFLFLGSYKEI